MAEVRTWTQLFNAMERENKEVLNSVYLKNKVQKILFEIIKRDWYGNSSFYGSIYNRGGKGSILQAIDVKSAIRVDGITSITVYFKNSKIRQSKKKGRWGSHMSTVGEEAKNYGGMSIGQWVANWMDKGQGEGNSNSFFSYAGINYTGKFYNKMMKQGGFAELVNKEFKKKGYKVMT